MIPKITLTGDENRNLYKKMDKQDFQLGRWAMNAEDWGYPKKYFWEAYTLAKIGTRDELQARIDARPARYARIMRHRNGGS